MGGSVFSAYAAIVKNLRGVILFDPAESGAKASLKWLVNRFKYRHLGVTPSLARKCKNALAKHVVSGPLRELAFPVPALVGFAERLSCASISGRDVIEFLVFASTYISPGILVGSAYLDELRALSVDSVYTCRELKQGEWKLHLRIADYTVLDMYEWSIKTARKAVQLASEGSDVSKVLEERASRIKSDKKRYWRIACNEYSQPFLLYVDLLRVLVERAPDVLKGLDESSLAALAIVPVVFIPPGMK